MAKQTQKYVIGSEEIDPSTLYISVEMTPDVPIDRLQRINGAVQMKRELNLPDRYILEELGVPDPDRALADYEKEQFKKAVMAGVIQRLQTEASGALQQMAQQMAQQMMAEAQQQQQQQAQQPPDQGQGMSPDQIGQFGQMANPSQQGAPNPFTGQGNNPAAGGMPNAMATGGAPLTPRGLKSGQNPMGMPIPAIG